MLFQNFFRSIRISTSYRVKHGVVNLDIKGLLGNENGYLLLPLSKLCKQLLNNKIISALIVFDCISLIKST